MSITVDFHSLFVFNISCSSAIRQNKSPRGFLPRPPPHGQNAKTKSAEPAFPPATLPEYLEGRTQKEKHPFLFQNAFTPSPANQKCKERFFLRGCRVKR